MQNNKGAKMAAVLLALSAFAHGQESIGVQPQPGYGFAPTVKELMRIDAEKARAAALGQSSDTTNKKPQEPVVATPPEPQPSKQLIGIYGHSGRWSAEVAIDGRSRIFNRGDAYMGFKATHVDSRCVHLQHPKYPEKLCVKG